MMGVLLFVAGLSFEFLAIYVGLGGQSWHGAMIGVAGMLNTIIGLIAMLGSGDNFW